MWTLWIALAAAGDIDNDGIDDAVDNCVYAANTDQVDGNGDGYGDACAHPTATVGANVVIGRTSYIHEAAQVGDGAVLVRSQVGAGAVVGPDAVLMGDVGPQHPTDGATRLGAGVVVGRRGTVGSGAVLAANVLVQGVIGASSSIGERSAVLARARVAAMGVVGADTRIRGEVGPMSSIGDSVFIGRSVLGSHVTVADGVRIGRGVVVEDGATIGQDARVGSNSTIGADARIGAGASIRWRVSVGENADVGEGAAVARSSVVPSGRRVADDAAYTGDGPVEDAEVCTDSVDNDGDAQVDCLDADCAVHWTCRSETACDDHLDDDQDGLIDCADPDCRALGQCPGEGSCDDGVDNDADRYIDCSDPDCWGAPGCTTETLCYDGYDNDLDGWADEQDPDCGPLKQQCRWSRDDSDLDGRLSPYDADCVMATVESGALCADGVDNDSDGLLDCEDSGCVGAAGCIEVCTDGIDNDGDGDRDCDDVDCVGEPCLVERRVLAGTVTARIRRDFYRFERLGRDASGRICGDFGMDVFRGSDAEVYLADVQMETRLRVPDGTDSVTSTCVVAPYSASASFSHTREGRAALAPVDAIAADIRGRPNRVGGSGPGCEHLQDHLEAATLALDAHSRWTLDAEGRPLAVVRNDSWDIGQADRWHGYVDRASSSEQGSSWCIANRQSIRSYHTASWELPPQTHTVSSP